MRILVLGGTRFIGPPAVRALVADGHDVTLFHRGPGHPPLPSQTRCVHGDRVVLNEHAEALRRLEPEVVLDMRPIDETDAEAVMTAFRGVAARVVAISSVDVYRAYGLLIGLEQGPIEPTPLDENSPLRSVLRPYRAQASGPDDYRHRYDKIPAEQVFLADPELPGTVLRLPMVYGPGDYQHRLHPWLKRMDDGRHTILIGAAMAAWRAPRGYVEDVGHAIALAVGDARARGCVYNVAEEEHLTELEWLGRVAEAASWNGRVQVVPDAELPAHLAETMRIEQPLSVASHRIRAELGYREALPPAERLARSVAWERANPPASIDPAAFDYAAEDRALGAAPSPPGPGGPEADA